MDDHAGTVCVHWSMGIGVGKMSRPYIELVELPPTTEICHMVTV